jgi:hypothetical protein
MASQVVEIDIWNSSFIETGLPSNPVSAKDIKLSRADKTSYKDFISEVSIASTQIAHLKQYYPTASISNDHISIELPYEPETSKTYKFLGMDIDEDFNAIIKLPQGHVVVAPMFDREAALTRLKQYDRRRYVESYERFVRDLSKEGARKFATGIKTGVAFDILSANTGSDSIDPETLKPLFSILDPYITDDFRAEFQSVILNLTHEHKAKTSQILDSSSRNDILIFVAKALIAYWSIDVNDKYQSLYSFLSEIDLWQDQVKKVIGESELTSRMSNCVKIKDPVTGDSSSTISISGISRNGSMSDANIIRSTSARGLISFISGLGSRYNSVDYDDLKDVLPGMVDTDQVGDVFGMSDAELQAMAAIDSLQYVDEDAALSLESYDMSDPEQRGLYVKSAIRSYERNFKEFKPSNNYDVTESLADMIERGDIISRPVVPQAIATDDTEADTVTSSAEEVDVSINKAKLLKIMKMVYKSTNAILKGF